MAVVRLYIIDDKSLKGVPGALVVFLDYDGSSPVSQFTADAHGVVYLDSGRNSFELEPGRQASIAADGYGQAGILGGDIGLYDGYEVLITKQNSAFPWWLLFVAGGLVYVAGGSRKKMGAFDQYGALGLVGVALAELMDNRKTVVKF
jgi:hypothetical protein